MGLIDLTLKKINLKKMVRQAAPLVVLTYCMRGYFGDYVKKFMPFIFLYFIFAIPILFTIWLYNWKLNFGKLEFGYSGNFYDKLPNSKSITPPLKSCCRVPVFMMKNSNLYWLRWNRQFNILSHKIWLDSSHSKMM